MSRLALIAGRGGLPGALLGALPARPLVCALDGFVPDGVQVDHAFRVERLVPFLNHLEDAGITHVAFAGAVSRPALDPSLFDAATATMVPRLLAAMGQGDDATLRVVLAIFEEAGFAISGVKDIAPGLVPGPGLYAGEISERDKADAIRAAQIVAAMGAVDVGQGCVVAQGLCLGVEALPGTDALLASISAIPAGLRPKARGLYFKAPKPGQDQRIDLPALGVQTVINVAKAGLGGIVWAADGVICLDLPAMQAEAQARGLFLWAR